MEVEAEFAVAYTVAPGGLVQYWNCVPDWIPEEYVTVLENYIKEDYK